jgi:hypothetical protein
MSMRLLQALAVCTAALAFAPAANAGGNEGYLVDKDGRIIKSMTSGLCVRSVRWNESTADRACLEKLRSTRVATRK